MISDKLSRLSINRSATKRVKERSLEEALQILRKIPAPLLQPLKSEHHRRLVQLLLSSQIDAVNTSASACRKLDQVIGRIFLYNMAHLRLVNWSLYSRVLCSRTWPLILVLICVITDVATPDSGQQVFSIWRGPTMSSQTTPPGAGEKDWICLILLVLLVY